MIFDVCSECHCSINKDAVVSLDLKELGSVHPGTRSAAFAYVGLARIPSSEWIPSSLSFLSIETSCLHIVSEPQFTPM